MNKYEHVHEGKQFCKKSKADWTIQELQSQRSDLDWYKDHSKFESYGVCNVADNGGISACADICQSINDCVYFSTSETQECYACFVYKTCDDPIDANYENEYKIYRLTKKGDTQNMYIQIIVLE